MKFKLFCLSVLFVIGAVTICSADNTHMEVEPANFVTLKWECSHGQCGFWRLRHDGVTELFAIPERMVFVVTEFDWRYKEEGQLDISTMLEFSLIPFSPPLDLRRQVKSYGFTQSIGCGWEPICFPTFGASGSEQMTTGFVVPRGSGLVPRIGFAFNDAELDNAPSKLRVTVRGYIVEPSCGFDTLPPCGGGR